MRINLFDIICCICMIIITITIIIVAACIIKDDKVYIQKWTNDAGEDYYISNAYIIKE